MKPVLVERLPQGTLELTFQPLVNDVTVSGSAPSIEASAGAATTTLTAAEIHVRTPANLMQALENVAGVNQVSEGQAAVPAIRGLARGRTLILIDGARVSSERRVGPSATYLDPDVIEGVEVARGPGRSPMDPMRSAASSRCGRGVSRRKRRFQRASPARLALVFRIAVPGSRSPMDSRAAACSFCRAYARRRGLRWARRRGLQLGLLRSRLSRARHVRTGRRASVGRLAERLRSRHRAAPQQLADRPLLLSNRGLAPADGQLRRPRSIGILARAFTGFAGCTRR